MAFVPVPKDLNRVKTKVMFNLTKRQLICFSIAAAVGVPIFFLAKAHLDLSTAAMLMVVIMLPFIFFALYEKDGQPAEKYLYHIVQSMFIRDKGKFQAIAASISGKLSLVISLPILDILVPCLDIKARGFQVFLAIPNADCGTLQSFDSLGSFRHCTVIGFR